MPQNLHKSRTNKVFAGVCGGVGEYFNVDATIIRLVWALAFFLGGTGFILYILAMIIMPDDPVTLQKKQTMPKTIVATTTQEDESDSGTEDDAEPNEAAPNPTNKNSGEDKKNQIFGLILVVLGGYFLLERYIPFFEIRHWWPMALIIIGLFVIFKGRGGSR